ncbi:MAG: TetR/AcrR family transcriptional regulator, partial [Eubacterium sp.]|nr:TetR/AcrR family transcriptional regulator [Eubacterium sp.]
KYFYDLGYNKTRMQDIAKDSGISLGTLTYYFKKKENLVSTILKNYLERLYDFTLKNFDKSLNALELHFYASIPFYENLLTEKNTQRFYYEYSQAQSIHKTTYGGDDLAQFITKVYHQTLKDYCLFVSDIDTKLAQKFGYGGRIQMIIDFVEGDLEGISIPQLANFLSSSREILLGIPKSEMDRIGRDAIAFNQTVDFSHIMPLNLDDDFSI